LNLALLCSCYPTLKKRLVEKSSTDIKKLTSFESGYQRWYSEAIALVRQTLPDRLQDFLRHYEKPKTRKEITNENYRIEDYLQGIEVTRGYEKEKVVEKAAAIPHFQQQLAIVEAAQARFDSSLFDIRQILEADLLDSELDAADYLAKNKFGRAAGALAGVGLERHLGQVCADHKLVISKKTPTIGDFNEALKSGGIIDLPQWRFIQHLADLRNLCDHARTPEPTAEQIADLISGVKKICKTVY
jgi:hypothetical protein